MDYCLKAAMITGAARCTSWVFHKTRIKPGPTRLIITISKGKTGHRISNTMSGAVSVYKRIEERNPNFSKDDFLFFPTKKLDQMPSALYNANSMHSWNGAS